MSIFNPSLYDILLLYYVESRTGLMPASNIYTYIFEKPFDSCTTTATTTTRDLYYFSHNAAYYHQCTEIHHPLFFGSAAFGRFPYFAKQSSDVHTKFSIFVPPSSEITKSAKHLFVCLLRFLLLPPLPMPSKIIYFDSLLLA